MDGWKALRLGVLWTFAVVLALAPVEAQESKVAVFTSRRFDLHTDLSAAEAQQALDSMEATLKIAEDYWRAKPRGKVCCYLLKSQAAWLDSDLPHPLFRVTVDGVGGATISEPTSDGRKGRYTATIYASARSGVVEHEVVHAYCMQAFGATGPDWYKEGMAEVVASRGTRSAGVLCPAERLAELRAAAPKSIAQVIDAGAMTNKISESLINMLATRTDAQASIALDKWTPLDAENALQARRDYLWSWALCHLLVHNPNYSARFRTLGESFLEKRDDSFQRAFGATATELDFEYRMFLDCVATGYRADLCAWDWQVRFRSPEAEEKIRRRVLAARGYQPSGMSVSLNRRYAWRAEGEWATTADGPMMNADGAAAGGRLTGVIMTDYRLGEPFALGTEGTFLASATGDLYLRCADAWEQLSDNRGEMCVHLSEP